MMKSWITLALLIGVMVVGVIGQPAIPNTTDLPCSATPGNNVSDTVVADPDSMWYRSIFNGTDFTGWWQSCQTGHSSANRAQGAIFRVSPDDKAIYSTRRGNAGGIIMTKKKWDHYELFFEFWPDFDNDAGIFHRTTAGGRCFQTVLDYNSNASVGGTWGEGGYTGRDIRPWRYVTETDINIPNITESWTNVTQANDPTSYGCAASGCVEADYFRLWDTDGWMQMKIQFYNGITNATKIHMKSYFRKPTSDTWVPILFDTTLTLATPANFMGIQVHQGGRFTTTGNWYRNLKVRPLTADGEPIPQGKVGCMDQSYEEFDATNEISDMRECKTIIVDVIDKEIKINGVNFHNRLGVTINSPGNFDVKLTDVYGKVMVKKEFSNPGTFKIGKKELTPGVYFLNVKNEEKEVTKKYIFK